MALLKPTQLTADQIASYQHYGHLTVSGIFPTELVEQMKRHYMQMRSEGSKPGDFGGTPDDPDDPTHQYPRLINMHNWDEESQTWATSDVLLSVIGQLIQDQPKLYQTMLYFKPPGGRGQGLHQDQQYITIDPLIGVWVALDRSDQLVGQMIVVPRSHQGGLYQVEPADTSVSFTNVQCTIPSEYQPIGVDMLPGDVLFFDGKTIHGSEKNQTNDRWRRSFICHYIGQNGSNFQPVAGTHVSHI